MGLFRVRGRLTGPTGRSEDVDLLVDTGARTAWPVAEARLALEDQEVTTPCSISPEGLSKASSWLSILSRSA